MYSVWGNKVQYSLFGESHGKGVGLTIHGLPAGIAIDYEKIREMLKRRQTGGNLRSRRRESDKVLTLSGEKDGKTSGAPLTFFIENEGERSKDYDSVYRLPRPSHADFSQMEKFGIFADIIGGGHLSGRLTAPICVAGAFILSMEEMKEISISSHIKRIADVEDEDFSYEDLEKLSVKEAEAIKKLDIPMFSEKSRNISKQRIEEAIKDGDSLGSMIELSVRGIKSGLGEPFFYGLESNLAGLIFSIPAVKALEFGKGTEFSKLKGSEANDEFYFDNEKVKTRTNNSGGINGGISNGMPINLRVSFRPTPSISKTQRTVDLEKGEDSVLSIVGRHDPCIGLRAVPVLESAIAIAIYDLL